MRHSVDTLFTTLQTPGKGATPSRGTKIVGCPEDVVPVTARRPAARLKDVAELAGVSVKTVSNVVNNFPYIKETTRSKVQLAIEELQYRPNVSARNLRNGRSGVIALAVPELDAPYFSELAHHIVGAAMAQNWTVLVDETQGRRDRERAVAAGIRGNLIDGAILSPLALTENDLQQLSPATPLVLLGERLGSGQADHVAIDNQAAAREATAHLIAVGRRRIAVVGAQRAPYGHTARLRIKGYREALSDAGLTADPELVVPARQWRRQAGSESALRLLALDRPPDAIFCLNDLLALGVLRTLAEARVRVPDDIAVMGFDDIEESRYSVPSLSTISPDKATIAAQAVERLAQRLDRGPGAHTAEVTVGYTLMARESTAR
jgi:DNA-binding LacI/PurR family transcriptional regulator